MSERGNREGREEGLEESDWKKEEREEGEGREGEGGRVVRGSLGLPSTEGGPFFSLTPSIRRLLHPRVEVAHNPRVL